MSKNRATWKNVGKEGGITHFLAVNTCRRCGTEYSNGNVFASDYCPTCAELTKREKTAERVRQYRARQRAAGQ